VSPTPGAAPKKPRGRGALFVAAGILFSRFFGLIRERVFAHFLGNSIEAAAFKAALRIPNFLQNLFGEGVLSASFIPVYARLLEKNEKEAADRLANAVFGLLALSTSLLVLGGLVATPVIIDLVAPGFRGEARELTIQLVRILFPGTGLLVLSAWCLGILNSHRKFFLSYAAPVLWNCAIIAALALGGGRVDRAQLARIVAYGACAGSLLQFVIQLPTVMRLLGTFRPTLNVNNDAVRTVLRGFLPVLIGRGVVQVSAYVDTAYASLISERALSALSYAQTMYLIPISVFGMAVSAAELPEMSRAIGTTEEVAAKLRNRVSAGTRRIAFYIVPSAAVFLMLGDVAAAALLQTGRFTPADTRYLWYLLIGSTVGLAAATFGRLYSSAFYALRQQRIPLYFATIRVALTAVLAWWSVRTLPAALGVPRELGAVGITATTGLAAWIEFVLLRRRLQKEIGQLPSELPVMWRLWFVAAVSALVGLGIKVALTRHFGPAVGAEKEWGGQFLAMPNFSPILTALLTLPLVGVLYLVGTWLLRVEEADAFVGRVMRKLGGRR
jgi:putative peptidoglycan lipid II flippase